VAESVGGAARDDLDPYSGGGVVGRREVLMDELGLGTDRDIEADDVTDEAEGRAPNSSTAGGWIPSSVYNQSICTNVAESWLRRFDWENGIICSVSHNKLR
jgi:hypothetical protein